MKFIPALYGSSEYVLGYVIEVTMNPLDMNKVPEKYKRTSKSWIYAVGVLAGKDYDQATYRAKFSFLLKDKDGFELATVEGKKDYLHSGEKKTFQKIADGTISPVVLARTKQVVVHVNVETCETCMR